MPRLTTKLPTYRKHPSGQAIVKLNGVVHYLGKHGSRSSKVQYDRLVSQWLASNRSPTFGVPEDKKEITVVQIIREYRKWAESYYLDESGRQTSTLAGVATTMKRLRKCYGSEQAEDFTPLAFKDVVKRMVSEGLSVSTINASIARIKSMFRWAASEELISQATYDRLCTIRNEIPGKTKAKPRRVVQAVSDADIDATLPHLPAMVRDMVRLQRLTGARPGELCKLRVSEIKAVGDVLVYQPNNHKTKHHGKSRTIVIAGEAIDILKPYMTGESDYVFSSVKSMMQSLAERTAKRVTPLNAGNKPKADRKVNGSDKYREDSYRRAIKRGCEAAKITPWSPNQLRHAAAVDIQSTLGIEAVAAVLGHSKIDTSKIYAKHNLALAIEAAKAITGGKADAKA
jgi:integrase